MKTPTDCMFYQTIELPGMGVMQGSWDHRDAVDVFLGRVDFMQKRVLDVGPGNGFFSFEMEKRGGRVTAIDLGPKSPWDVVPHPFLDEDELISNMRSNVRQVENAFWFAHKALASKVNLIYGSVYEVPEIVEEVDIALMSNVLQHFRDPLRAIQRVAQVVKETIVITETLWVDDPAFIESTSMHFIPRSEAPEVSHSWWQVSPGFVIELLKLVGFPDVRMEIHYQQFNGSTSDTNPRLIKHFTITAGRALPLDSLELGQAISFGPEFYALEATKKHTWRWSAGPSSTIHVLNVQHSRISARLHFGLSSITPNATIRVLINGKLSWEGSSFYGTRPVAIGTILLPGNNTVEISSDGKCVGPTASDPRTLCFALYDLLICKKPW